MNARSCSRYRLVGLHVHRSLVIRLVLSFARLEVLADSVDGTDHRECQLKEDQVSHTEHNIRSNLCLAFESNSRNRFERLRMRSRTVGYRRAS